MKPQKQYPPGEYQCPGCYSAFDTAYARYVHRRDVHGWRPNQPGDAWWDNQGVVTIIACAEGYAMCRRPGCIPFVMSKRDIP